MALSSKVGKFNITTGTSNVVVTGVGFQPKVVMLLGGGKTADGVSANIDYSFGAGTSASNYVYAQNEVADAVTTTSSAGRSGVAAIFRSFFVGGNTVEGIAALSSLDSDGFTLSISDAFATDQEVSYLALGGTSLTNAYAEAIGRTSGTGVFSETGVGFQPDLLLILSGYRSGTDTNYVDGNISFGAAKSVTERFFVSAVTADAKTSGSVSKHLSRTDRVAEVHDGDTLRISSDFSSFDADGFSLTTNTNPSGSFNAHAFLVTKGLSSSVGSFNFQTSTGNFSVTGLGFKPAALILVSTVMQTSASSTWGNSQSFAMGFTDGTAQHSFWFLDENAEATSKTNSAQSTSSLLVKRDTEANSNAILSEIDFVSFGADGFTLNQTTTDGTGYIGFYVALGPADAGAGGEILYTNTSLRFTES